MARRRTLLEVEQLEGRVLLSTIILGTSKDNTLYQSIAGDISNGAGANFFAGRTNGGAIRRGVIAFDIAGNIPAGATINSVILGLNMSQTMAGPETVELRPLLADWGEGTSNANAHPGQGAPATTNDATWIYRFFNTTATWTNPGGDFAGTASATTSVGGFGPYTWGSTAQMVADVQGWLNNPGSNFGWLVLGDETTPGTAKRFDTKDNPTPANRPTLTIDYTASTSTATSLALSGFPSTITAGVAGTETVTAKDSSGNTATDYRGTVHFTSTDPQAVLPPDYAFTAADAGVHPFNITLKTAGNRSITATDTTTSSITGSQSGIIVAPAAADHLTVDTPATVTAGAPFNVTVTARDPFSNQATGYVGTVAFTSSDSGTGVVLPANYTFTASDNGLHTFSNGATLIHAGSQTITATDTTTTSITGTSALTVVAAALHHFSITAAGTVAAGVPFDLIVTAQDAYGNTVTGYTGTVTFTTSDQDPNVSLPPDYTFTSGDNGTHTFSGGATLYTMGMQTITVTDTSDNTITGILMVLI
jgi:hypothetical protein